MIARAAAWRRVSFSRLRAWRVAHGALGRGRRAGAAGGPLRESHAAAIVVAVADDLRAPVLNRLSRAGRCEAQSAVSRRASFLPMHVLRLPTFVRYFDSRSVASEARPPDNRVLFTADLRISVPFRGRKINPPLKELRWSRTNAHIAAHGKGNFSFFDTCRARASDHISNSAP
jgi:hypothetical protein